MTAEAGLYMKVPEAIAPDVVMSRWSGETTV